MCLLSEDVSLPDGGSRAAENNPKYDGQGEWAVSTHGKQTRPYISCPWSV
jgi:hypothetical protein